MTRATALSPDLARAAWAAVEPIHLVVYFAPEAAEQYTGIGLEPVGMGYFASRSAPLGPAGPQTVAATFYNFSPALVSSVIPHAWSVAAPESVLKARHAVADTALRRILGVETVGSAGLREAADLARTAALAAAEHPQGRPLFAAHAALDWPEEPHNVLWHAATLLREFRGDGHVATLLTSGVGPLEALVTYAAAGGARASTLRRTRGWSDEEWEAGVASAVEQGWVATGEDGAPVLTDAGRTLRSELEGRTDTLSVPAFAAIGEDGCRRLAELTAPLVTTIRAEGILPGTRPRRS
ncbi:hypothetical protein HNR12_002266 [Streptomonospora nanhaiensis]|uniref:SalK n=1 Tax=Streptomonospora nanhaiensis TaxID=1323731 RepID=A0A853BKG3_9ACTN|nr:hypothetical protein [Streptomonospora nanhaiensis]NYI95989.1 hypothetical protein [Streptomonospora nanhaiensis]